jgi:ferredoxin-NADP reductase
MHNHDEHEHHHHETAPVDIPEERRAICPVTGDLIDKEEADTLGHVREYNGKKIYFCCATCVKLFDKNPDKYTVHHDSGTSLTLIEKENLVDNVWAFRFTSNKPVSWTAGQFIRVELDHENPDDEGTKRWFTISSAPYENIIQITTRVTESTFKQALFNLPVSEKAVIIDDPDGDFIWEDSDRQLVFVAGGIGITPFRSMLKQRAHAGLPLDVTLIYGNRTDTFVFKDEFDAYVARDSRFQVRYVIGEPLTAAKLIELKPDLNTSLVYVSGPESMVQALGADLKAHGLPENQLKTDEFPNYNETNY